MQGIQINLRNSCSSLDDSSKFFGTPILPKSVKKHCSNDQVLFIAQINSADLKPYDKDGILKKDGWFYIFYDVFRREFEVFFDKGEQEYIMEGFNKKVLFGKYQASSEPIIEEFENDLGSPSAVAMFIDTPEHIKQQDKKYENSAVLMRFDAKVMEKLSKPFLVITPKYAYILVSKKDLLKGKFTNTITLHE